MAVFYNTNMQVLVDQLDLAGFATSAQLTAELAELDVTTLASNGFRQKISGLGQFALDVQGYQDFAAGLVDDTFRATATGQNTITIVPQNGGATIGDVAYFGAARTVTRQGLAGSVGDVAGFSLNWVSDGRLARGQIIHPLAARAATGSGTTTTFTTPTTGQFLCASFHVTAVTGSGSITFTIQTDDNSGMTTPATRITATAMTAIGGQFASVAGPFAGETHVRVGYTISGFSSVTFAVAAGLSTTPA